MDAARRQVDSNDLFRCRVDSEVELAPRPHFALLIPRTFWTFASEYPISSTTWRALFFPDDLLAGMVAL